MKRRILSSLMALVLVFGLLPATAFAEGETVPDGKAKIGTTEYATLEDALKAAQDNDTIYLGEGTYSSYKSTAVKGKNLTLTFVGAGTGKTVWNMGTSVAGRKDGGEDGDYSFDGSEKVTFKDMTLRSSVKDGTGEMVTRNNTGFVRIQHIVVDNCIIEGRTTYWGYTDTEFHNTKFYAPGHPELNGILKNNEIDYVLWTGTGTKYTFDTCTFYANMKIVHLYRDYGAGTTTVEINFNDCTVKNTGWALFSKQVLNIKDKNNDYIVNISGTNTVTGVNPNRTTCSRWFQVESVGEGYSHYATVNIDGKPVWQGGEMVSHAIDTANDKYTDGYKDDAFTVDEGKWTEDSNGIWSRKVTKTCDYCGYKEETTEYKPIEWNVPKSKTATQLDTNTWTSDVTLSLLNTKEDLEEGKDRIGAGSTVTDTIGKKFDFVGIKSLTVGGVALDSKTEGTVTYFGDDANALSKDSYRFKVDYDSAKTFVWTIDEKVTQSEPVQLTYTVKLTTPETKPGTYGTKDLKGDDLTLTDAEALFTNESAVLNAKNSVGVPVEEQVFPKPSVSYTISSGTGGDDGDDDDDKYFFAIQKVDAQDGHALNGAKFGLYLDGKQVATATSNRSGIAMFRVNESDYRKINAKSDLYYQELTAPEGYVVNSDEVSIEKSNLTTSWSKAEKDAETVRNYRGVTPDLLNDSDHFAYVIGYMDGNVRPYGLISRAETTTIFFRLLKDSVRDGNLLTSNTYTDVPDSYWANTAISTMTGLGIVQGRSADTFDPKAPITRAQFAAICARFDTGKSSGEQTFSDIQGHWAEKYIERAAELGWIKGFEDGTFRPDTYITRAQAMTMINRVLNRIPEDESDLLPGMNVWPDCNPGDWFYLAVQEATNSHDFKHKAGNYETWTGMNKDPDWTRYEH